MRHGTAAQLLEASAEALAGECEAVWLTGGTPLTSLPMSLRQLPVAVAAEPTHTPSAKLAAIAVNLAAAMDTAAADRNILRIVQQGEAMFGLHENSSVFELAYPFLTRISHNNVCFQNFCVPFNYHLFPAHE